MSFRMFHNSTQRNHWTFCDKAELSKLRERTNQNYLSRMITRQNLPTSAYLTASEELHFIQEHVMKNYSAKN